MPQTKTISIGLVSILFAFLISGCVSVSDKNMQNYRLKSVPLTKNTQTQASSVIYELYQQHREWQGVRYRLGGQSKVGVDCSGFVQLTYQSKLGVYLPRTARQQSKLGTKIQKRELEAGDLVFLELAQHQNMSVFIWRKTNFCMFLNVKVLPYRAWIMFIGSLNTGNLYAYD